MRIGAAARNTQMTPEIRAFEYAIGVFAVLIGLAIADIATSFHRLLRSKSAVIWDPLALSAALYAICMAIYMWFDLWGVRNFAATRNFVFYLLLFSELFVLFLVAASSLPDEAETLTDLREFYSANRRKFWLLVVLFQLGYRGDGLLFRQRSDCDVADIGQQRVDLSDDRAACLGPRAMGDEVAVGALCAESDCCLR